MLRHLRGKDIPTSIMSLKNPKSLEWKILYVFWGTVDLIQILLDAGLTEFVGAPEAINEIADPFLGAGMGIYFQLRGISMVQKPSRLLSIIGGDIVEQLSASVAPAWIVDVWYIHRTVKEEWAAEQASLAENEEEEGPVNRMVEGKMTRKPPVIQKPSNQMRDGKMVRLPNGGV
jgi:hypothetical protein